ncbi:hypothetical protein [Burkholderia sp. Ac-20344]|uniref:hypothetical protein n=1 Tax=Burkholderia sp. Ac-20344 TaxID=2703890 RepID=UPI00197B48E2|nr:hypothetical protein [Burkholderia sp. Ac-20344]MBN3831915.1 hypothetical protein [Burkholderia sp. Ac-20344]
MNHKIKIKPIDEGMSCIVFNPESRTMHKLTTSAWFILEMCHFASQDEIEQNLADSNIRLQAHQVRECLSALEKIGAIVVAP